MAYVDVSTNGGLYLIDWDLVGRIAYSSAFNQSKLTNAQRVKKDHGFLMPTTYQWEIDYRRAKADAKKAADAARNGKQLMRWFDPHMDQVCRQPTQADIEDFRDWMFEQERRGRRARDALQRKLDEAHRLSMANVNRNVGNWQTAIDIAGFVRDSSANVLMIGATVLSGGAAGVALAGAGSTLKGVGKWQETGKLAAGALTATFSFVTFFIPGGDKVKEMGKGAVLTVTFIKKKAEFTGDVTVGLAEGKSLKDASISAAVGLATGVGAGKINDRLLSDSTMADLAAKAASKAAIPVTVKRELIGAGVVSTSIDRGKKALDDYTTGRIMAAIKGSPVKKNRLPRRVTVSDPVISAIAILGPDKSSGYPHWAR